MKSILTALIFALLPNITLAGIPISENELDSDFPTDLLNNDEFIVDQIDVSNDVFHGNRAPAIDSLASEVPEGEQSELYR